MLTSWGSANVDPAGLSQLNHISGAQWALRECFSCFRETSHVALTVLQPRLSQWKPMGKSISGLQCVLWHCDNMVWPLWKLAKLTFVFRNHFQTFTLYLSAFLLKIQPNLVQDEKHERETSALLIMPSWRSVRGWGDTDVTADRDVGERKTLINPALRSHGALK